MKKKIDYDNWSKGELVKEIKRIKETTYGLVWHRDLSEGKNRYSYKSRIRLKKKTGSSASTMPLYLN